MMGRITGTWEWESVEGLLRREREAWCRVPELCGAIAARITREYGFSPSQRDDVRGETLCRLIQEDMRLVKSCRDATVFPSFVEGLARRVAWQILGRADSTRLQLDADISSGQAKSYLHSRAAQVDRGDHTAPRSKKSDIAGDLERILSLLSDEQLQVVELRRAGLTWSAVASNLHISRDAARQRFRRALKRLKRLSWRFAPEKEGDQAVPPPELHDGESGR